MCDDQPFPVFVCSMLITSCTLPTPFFLFVCLLCCYVALRCCVFQMLFRVPSLLMSHSQLESTHFSTRDHGPLPRDNSTRVTMGHVQQTEKKPNAKGWFSSFLCNKTLFPYLQQQKDRRDRETERQRDRHQYPFFFFGTFFVSTSLTNFGSPERGGQREIVQADACVHFYFAHKHARTHTFPRRLPIEQNKKRRVWWYFCLCPVPLLLQSLF